jgi:hypothetical protein
MFNKFQQKLKKLSENTSSTSFAATSNSTSGGVFGPNATENSFSSTPIKVDMAIAGGIKPLKKRKKKSKSKIKKPFFPIARRAIETTGKEF